MLNLFLSAADFGCGLPHALTFSTANLCRYVGNLVSTPPQQTLTQSVSLVPTGLLYVLILRIAHAAFIIKLLRLLVFASVLLHHAVYFFIVHIFAHVFGIYLTASPSTLIALVAAVAGGLVSAATAHVIYRLMQSPRKFVYAVAHIQNQTKNK